MPLFALDRLLQDAITWPRARLGGRMLGNPDGGTAIIAALGAPMLGMLVAGGITLADAEHRRSVLQDALDGAALAGASQRGTEAEQVAAALAIFNANRSQAIGGATASFTVDGQLVTGVGSTTMPTLFAGLLGRESVTIGARAQAERSRTNICVLGLNGLDNGAFDITGNPEFSAPDCAVQANSGSSRAMTQQGGALARAGSFRVHGGSATNNFHPAPREDQATVVDPLAGVPFPQHRECPGRRDRGLVINGDVTLRPGTYCGGINITGSGVKVTMEPGVYVMVNGPLLVNGNAQLEGREVTVAFTGTDSTLRVWGNGSVDLTSPTTGTYANLQFFQNRRDSLSRGSWVSIGGNGGPSDNTDRSRLSIVGTAYFPTQNFWVYGAAETNLNSSGMALVADKIWVQGSARLAVKTEDRQSGIPAQSSARLSARLVS